MLPARDVAVLDAQLLVAVTDNTRAHTVKDLITAGANVNATRPHDSHSVLMIACATPDNLKVIAELVSCPDLDINYIIDYAVADDPDYYWSESGTVFHLLSYNKRNTDYCYCNSLMNMLLNCHMKPQLEIRDEFGSTALHTAINWQYLEVVKVLIGSGADMNSEQIATPYKGDWGDYNTPSTALIKSICMPSGPSPNITFALISGGCDVNLPDSEGRTAFTEAIRIQDQDILQALIDANVIITAKDLMITDEWHL
jgi:ankyrin repeat protein